MTDNPWKKIYMTLMLLMATLLVLTACASAVLAQDPPAFPGPPPPPPHAQALASDTYLYVLDMRTLYQYSLTDMRLKQTVALPDLPVITTSETTDGRPPMLPRATFLIEGDALVVLEMRTIYKYTIPGLDSLITVTLPEPASPGN